MNIEPEDISILQWVIKNKIVNEKGELLEFKDHGFLIDILEDFTPVQVVKKCAQVGCSVIYNLKVYYAADKGKFNIIYTMPSDADVSEFVKTKSDKIFQTNEVLRKKFSGDTIGLKQIGERFIYYKGTRSKTTAISTTADVLVHDEIDRSDLGIVEMYQSRLAASKYKGTWYLSNPSLIGVGVDEIWKLSDQKEWFIICPYCKTEQFLKWENNVDEIKGIYVCSNCGKEIVNKTRKLGKWKATKQGKEISGYHISQMMAPWLSAKDLIKERELRGDDYFRNFILGEPYSVGDEANIRQAILDGWTAEPLDHKPFYMGIDIGRIKHYVIGSEEGIFKMGKVESREEVEALIDKYNPIVVMDAGPERTWAEEFKNKYQDKIKQSFLINQ